MSALSLSVKFVVASSSVRRHASCALLVHSNSDSVSASDFSRNSYADRCLSYFSLAVARSHDIFSSHRFTHASISSARADSCSLSRSSLAFAAALTSATAAARRSLSLSSSRSNASSIRARSRLSNSNSLFNSRSTASACPTILSRASRSRSSASTLARSVASRRRSHAAFASAIFIPHSRSRARSLSSHSLRIVSTAALRSISPRITVSSTHARAFASLTAPAAALARVSSSARSLAAVSRNTAHDASLRVNATSLANASTALSRSRSPRSHAACNRRTTPVNRAILALIDAASVESPPSIVVSLVARDGRRRRRRRQRPSASLSPPRRARHTPRSSTIIHSFTHSFIHPRARIALTRPTRHTVSEYESTQILGVSAARRERGAMEARWRRARRDGTRPRRRYRRIRTDAGRWTRTTMRRRRRRRR